MFWCIAAIPVYSAVSALQRRKQEDVRSQWISSNNGALARTWLDWESS